VKIYTYNEAYVTALSYFDNNEMAAKVWIDKYALRDNDKNILEKSPEQTHWRMANEFARIEKTKFKNPLSAEEIFTYFDKFKYIVPQGGVIYGLGNPYQYVTLSNCYALNSPVDSYGGICATDEELVQISKRRGGCGTNLSSLRPDKMPTKNSSRTSSGPISFAKRFSHSIREVGQDGRRGALMLMMDVKHPTASDFAQSKLIEEEITGANISLAVHDDFIKNALKDQEYTQQWPIDSNEPKITQTIRAKELWDTIIQTAWESAEPGVLFWDTIIRESISDCYCEYGFKTIATNPCSELPLPALDSCRLLLMNLFSFVVNPFTKDAYFDYELFYHHAQIAQRLMDDLIDLELECIKRIIEKIESDPEDIKYKERELKLWQQVYNMCKYGRRTGTGHTALADTLAALDIKYGSKAAIAETEKIAKIFKFGCYKSSIDMAKELGPFPIWKHDLEKYNPFLNRLQKEYITINDMAISGAALYEEMKLYGRRNIACLTLSPAGTISVETQTTSGGEPILYFSQKRRKKGNLTDENFRCDFIDKNGDKWMEFEFDHPKVAMWKQITGKTNIKDSPWYGCCAEDLPYLARIQMQSALQKHIDHSISSTINLSSDTTVETVAKIYEEAWKHGLKGITIYREGCRSGVILNNADERPKELPCDVYHVSVRGQSYFVLVGLRDNVPFEIFAGRNGCIANAIKTGKIIRKKKGFYKAVFEEDDTELSPITSFSTETEEAITRLVSTSLRAKVDLNLVVTQLEKVGGNSAEIHGFAKVLARVLKKYIKDGAEIKGETCPDCQGPLVRKNGCWTCFKECGYSKCS
jgi:ribonucleoside-diphosphate reductase alpha chain